MNGLHEPRPSVGGAAELFADYLDWYRETAIAKVDVVPLEEQRRARLPSGWTPLELLNHLAFMEQRWLVWGFLGEQVAAPWGDDRDGRWHVAESTSTQEVVDLLRSVGERTRAVLASTPLERTAATGGRFDEDPPTLAWICFHVLQEYARHVGHLDIVVELAGGPTGE